MDRAEGRRFAVPGGRSPRSWWWPGPAQLRRRHAVALAALTVVVVVAGILGYRAWQAGYYEGLYTRNHTVPGGFQQLYRNGMLGVDRAWLVSKDGGRTYARTTWVGDEPVLTEGTRGTSMVALVPSTYGDAEVDLWMFQGGAGRTGETGLVLRADPASGNMVVFGVNQASGTWSVREHAHGRWIDLQSPIASDHIERRAGWNNLLTAIVRGGEYAFLINYHFVGVYHSDTLAQGHAGVYASDGTVTCACVDFEVFRNVAG